VYDQATGQDVLFGGLFSPENLPADTWVWTGTTWSQASPATSPPGRVYGAMAFDSATNQLVLFGGCCDNGGNDLGDTWIWTGSTWSQLGFCATPSAREFAALAFEPSGGRLILFGGDQSGLDLGDTWGYQSIQTPSITATVSATSPPPKAGTFAVTPSGMSQTKKGKATVQTIAASHGFTVTMKSIAPAPYRVYLPLVTNEFTSCG
jgi:hypothetical protein